MALNIQNNNKVVFVLKHVFKFNSYRFESFSDN